MLHLLHLADIHFGMENYGRLDPASGLNRRLLDFTRSVHTAIDYALDHDVHLAIFAGDIYKHRDPDPSWQRAFAGCVRRLAEAGVPVVILVGNHDPAEYPRQGPRRGNLRHPRTAARDRYQQAGVAHDRNRRLAPCRLPASRT